MKPVAPKVDELNDALYAVKNEKCVHKKTQAEIESERLSQEVLDLAAQNGKKAKSLYDKHYPDASSTKRYQV